MTRHADHVATTRASAADADLHLRGDELARGARDDLAVNVLAGGPPPWLRSAVAAALGELGAYPDEAPAIAAVAERHGRRADEVVLLNGASQAFWLAAALGPRRPVCVHPSFTEPEVALRAARRPPRRVVLDAPSPTTPTWSSSATRPTRPASCTPATSWPRCAVPAASRSSTSRSWTSSPASPRRSPRSASSPASSSRAA